MKYLTFDLEYELNISSFNVNSIVSCVSAEAVCVLQSA